MVRLTMTANLSPRFSMTYMSCRDNLFRFNLRGNTKHFFRLESRTRPVTHRETKRSYVRIKNDVWTMSSPIITNVVRRAACGVDPTHPSLIIVEAHSIQTPRKFNAIKNLFQGRHHPCWFREKGATNPHQGFFLPYCCHGNSRIVPDRCRTRSG